MKPERLVVIDNLIDTDYFVPDPIARARQRAAWGVADTELLIGMAARFDPMKGHDIFLGAAARLIRDRPSVRFVLIGGGTASYAGTLKRTAERLGLDRSLIWAGEECDMAAAYNALDLATLSSLEGEGFPNAVAEAMACGVPVVATDTGDTARLIGATGLIVPPGDAVRLADGWATLLASDRAGLGRDARQRILTEFDSGQALDHNLRVLMALA
jgi:glycosyltransferase involved in cell wall biosynthesis